MSRLRVSANSRVPRFDVLIGPKALQHVLARYTEAAQACTSFSIVKYCIILESRQSYHVELVDRSPLRQQTLAESSVAVNP